MLGTIQAYRTIPLIRIAVNIVSLNVDAVSIIDYMD